MYDYMDVHMIALRWARKECVHLHVHCSTYASDVGVCDPSPAAEIGC